MKRIGSEYTRYQALLAGLADADPPLQGAEALLLLLRVWFTGQETQRTGRSVRRRDVRIHCILICGGTGQQGHGSMAR